MNYITNFAAGKKFGCSDEKVKVQVIRNKGNNFFNYFYVQQSSTICTKNLKSLDENTIFMFQMILELVFGNTVELSLHQAKKFSPKTFASSQNPSHFILKLLQLKFRPGMLTFTCFSETSTR